MSDAISFHTRAFEERTGRPHQNSVRQSRDLIDFRNEIPTKALPGIDPGWGFCLGCVMLIQHDFDCMFLFAIASVIRVAGE